MIKTKELFDEAVSLPVEMRMQLVDKLLRSLYPTQKEIDESLPLRGYISRYV